MAKAKKSKKEMTQSAKAPKVAERKGLAGLLSSDLDLDRFFDEVVGKGWMRPWSWNWSDLESQMPRVDVIDREEDIVVKA